jgi:hypothetical protein
MTLRVHGTRDEVAAVTRRLVEVLEVGSVSAPYPDRGASRLVRVYLEIRLPPRPGGDGAGGVQRAGLAGEGAVAAMRVKLTTLRGDNATSGLLVDGNYMVHRGPDEQGRVWVFDEGTDSFRAVTSGEYREVPDPLEPHDLVRIDHDQDGWWVVCSCVWRDPIPAADPDEAAHTYRLLHLRQMEEGRYHLTTWGDPQLLQLLQERRQQQWYRRREEPER